MADLNMLRESIIVEFKTTDGKVMGSIVASRKEFSSGSIGFYANGKVADPGHPEQRFQVGCNITLIGSKPKA